MILYDKIPKNRREYWDMFNNYQKLLKKKRNQIIKGGISKAFDIKEEIYDIFREMEKNMLLPEGEAQRRINKWEKEFNSPADFKSDMGDIKRKIYNKIKKKFNKK